jgi:hypothetical protein
MQQLLRCKLAVLEMQTTQHQVFEQILEDIDKMDLSMRRSMEFEDIEKNSDQAVANIKPFLANADVHTKHVTLIVQYYLFTQILSLILLVRKYILNYWLLRLAFQHIGRRVLRIHKIEMQIRQTLDEFKSQASANREDLLNKVEPAKLMLDFLPIQTVPNSEVGNSGLKRFELSIKVAVIPPHQFRIQSIRLILKIHSPTQAQIASISPKSSTEILYTEELSGGLSEKVTRSSSREIETKLEGKVPSNSASVSSRSVSANSNEIQSSAGSKIGQSRYIEKMTSIGIQKLAYWEMASTPSQTLVGSHDFQLHVLVPSDTRIIHVGTEFSTHIADIGNFSTEGEHTLEIL